jgi:hypothetical protein
MSSVRPDPSALQDDPLRDFCGDDGSQCESNLRVICKDSNTKINALYLLLVPPENRMYDPHQ